MKAAACIIGSCVLTAAWIVFQHWSLGFAAGALNTVTIEELRGMSWRKAG